VNSDALQGAKWHAWYLARRRVQPPLRLNVAPSGSAEFARVAAGIQSLDWSSNDREEEHRWTTIVDKWPASDRFSAGETTRLD